MNAQDEMARKVDAVRDEIRRDADRTMPGNSAALPEGALQRRPVDNQSDEHREQPLAPDGTPRAPDPPPGT